MFSQKIRFICVVENNGKTDDVNNCMVHAVNSIRKALRENGINTKDVGINICDNLTKELLEKGFRPNNKSFYVILEIDTIHNFMEISSIVKNWHRFYTFVAPTINLKIGNGSSIAINNNPYTTRNTITNEETITPIIEFVDLGEAFEKMFTKANQLNAEKEKAKAKVRENLENRDDCLSEILLGRVPIITSSVNNFKNTIRKEPTTTEEKHSFEKNVTKETKAMNDKVSKLGNDYNTNDCFEKNSCPNFSPKKKLTKDERTENFLIPKTEFEFLVTALFRNTHKFNKETDSVILTIVETQAKVRKIDLFMECDTFKVNGILKKATEKNNKMMLTINFENKVYEVYNDTLSKVSINETLNMIGIHIEDVFGKTQDILIKK